jgi:hypothetical protein
MSDFEIVIINQKTTAAIGILRTERKKCCNEKKGTRSLLKNIQIMSTEENEEDSSSNFGISEFLLHLLFHYNC